MELFCLCCLVESELTFNLDSYCEFQNEECNDENQPAAIRLSEIYTQLTQLPPVVTRLNASSGQLMSNALCSQCAVWLKNFYLFRLKALKSYEDLQTKANIAEIICHLEHNSVGSVRSQMVDEDFGEDNLVMPQLQMPKNISGDDCPNGSFRCTVCEKMFKSRKTLLRHENVHRREKRHHCQYCERGFVAKASCSNHELKVHGLRKRSNGSGKKQSQKQLIRDDEKSPRAGGVQSKSKSSPITPKGKDTVGKKQYACDLCTKIFTRQSSLNDHKLVLHAGIRPYSCHVCSHAFGKEDSLKTHLALHLGKTHRCKLCGKAFAKSSFLRKHLENHESSESVRKYVCSVCLKRFTSKSHLTDHELIHGDQRPYKCTVCGDRFRQKQQLKVHNYQHVGKPFRCGECSAEFGSRSRLQAHVEKHHRQQDRTMEDVAMIQPDFGDQIVDEEILNEICYQIDSNPTILQNIEADGVNLICSNSEQIVFLADDGLNLLPDILEQCL